MSTSTAQHWTFGTGAVGLVTLIAETLASYRERT
jgi:hypothetical protein